MVYLTWFFGFIALEVLAAGALELIGAKADALPVQQGDGGAVLAGLALAHVVFGHVVLRGPPQVGYPGVCVLHVHRNQRVDGL